MITAWWCPGCKQVVPLSHYADSDCGLTVCPPDYAGAVLADRSIHDQRGVARVSIACGCPRSTAIMLTEDIIADPLAFNSALTGTAWHALLGEYQPASAEVEVTGVINGVQLTGHIDRIIDRGGRVVILDHKHGNDFARKYAELKPEYVVQVSLYADLYRQTFGEQPSGGVIWRHFTGSPPFVAFPFTLWPVEQCLDWMPYGGGYRVRDLLAQAASGDDWRDLPLAGASMNFGSRDFCSYCEVASVCKEAAGGAPW